MKITVVAILSILLFITAHDADAFVEPAAMGGIETIVPVGACDAGRNPSLLPFTEKPISVFAAGSYQIYDSSTASIENTITGGSSDFDMKSKNTRSFSVFTAASFRGESSGFGIMFKSGESALYTKNKRDINTTFIPSDLSYTAKSDEQEITTQRNPALALGWGIKTGQNSSFGIRVTGGLLEKNIQKDTLNDFSGTKTYSSFNDKTQYMFAECAIVFFYRENNIEGGFMFSSGRHGRWTQEYSYSISIPSTSTELAGKDNLTQKYLMTQAPGISMGSSYTFSPSVKAVFELVYQFPHSYTTDRIDYDSVSKSLVQKSTETNIKYGSALKAGIRYEASSKLSLMAGLQGFMIQTEENNDSSNDHSKAVTHALSAGAGTDYILSNTVTLGFALSCTYIRSGFTVTNSGSSTDIKYREIQSDIFAGASLRM